jgi:GH15 family glucan-1,4-alpha-glucosidase
LRLEDYGLIGDLHTAALVGRNGSIDWLCLPRFDSGACFAALLGDERHGRWALEPAAPTRKTTRRYRPGTLVLETEIETDDGTVRLVDCMPVRDEHPHLVRVVEGVRGAVTMRMELVIRFDYGSTVPWVQSADDALLILAGPNSLCLRTPIETEGKNFTTVAEFTVREGDQVPFVLSWHRSYDPPPDRIDPLGTVADTEAWWRDWSDICSYPGRWSTEVLTSMIVLKALTYKPTGGIVAAPTTSLPEQLGGARNWDYRYCWLRDAALTLDALLLGGYADEAIAFADWVNRATAGHPAQTQVMYGVAGERRLSEDTLDWLPGYEGSAPVRVGNAASEQFQLDIYGELLDALHRARMLAGRVEPSHWERHNTLLDYVESIWSQPDDGIWEVRGPRRHFTHSKVMAWVGFDRAVKTIERFKVDGPLERWRALRDEIHAQVCRKGYDPKRGTFTQYYGSNELDAAALLIPAVGFLPPDDERVRGTVETIERELTEDGFVMRYSTGSDAGAVDGLEGKEGAFLPCSFWLADALAMVGRGGDAERLFERVTSLANDLFLLSEEYDPQAKRLLGNFPQAFTHLALVSSASRRSPQTPTAGRAGEAHRARVPGS